MFIATLIAADRLSESDISTAAERLAGAEGAWVEQGSAYDFFVSSPEGVEAALRAALPEVDVVVQPEAPRRKRLLVADMDSTMISVECIDELADYAGIKPQIAEITERAMRGELDFEAALHARVALLRDLNEDVIDQCRTERVQITPGARTLVQTMRKYGAICILVSGGFTQFAEPVAEAIGFDQVIANRLAIVGGKLTGRVKKRPLVDAEFKAGVLLSERREFRLKPEETLAVGDGANDIPMIRAAGLGVAYRAKPAAAAAADARLEHNDLTALLYAQGIPRAEWVTA